MMFGGRDLIFKNLERSPEVKGQVKFQVAPIELKFGEGDEGKLVQNVYRGGCPQKSNEVKGQVKFEVAMMEAQTLGE